MPVFGGTVIEFCQIFLTDAHVPFCVLKNMNSFMKDVTNGNHVLLITTMI